MKTFTVDRGLLLRLRGHRKACIAEMRPGFAVQQYIHWSDCPRSRIRDPLQSSLQAAFGIDIPRPGRVRVPKAIAVVCK